MDLMVVPKPIFSVSKETRGYHLSFQAGNALIEEGRAHISDIHIKENFFDLINQLGLEALTLNKPLFVPASDILLATDIENNCAAERSLIVLMLNRKNSLSAFNLGRVKQLKERGFKIAFYSFPDIRNLDPFLPYTDYIFCDCDTAVLMPVVSYVKFNKYPIKIIAKGIDTSSIFDRIVALGIELFEGHFYKVPSGSKYSHISPLQFNYLQLLNKVRQEDFELDHFSKIVQRDPALAIQFLKMVNSSFARTSKIKSLRHAAAMVGQNEIKRWITTAVISSLSQEKPGEITRISLLRAKFCEDMAGHYSMAVHKDNLFLMGMFSVLDVILELPIEQALEMVLVPDNVKTALINRNNDFGKIYQFVDCYEQGDWTEVSRFALLNNIKISEICDAYYNTLSWYGRLVNMQLDESEDLE